jgi:hypothetical protein
VIGFLQPLALLGLAAAAIPPLLHLLGRRRPPTVVFPAIQYLTATEREHSRRLKLRNLLLLLLRVAAIVLIVLAAARPVARVQAGTSHPPTALAVVVDNSLSSGAVVAGQTVLTTLTARARDVLEHSEAGDQLWLVLADGELRRVTRTTAHGTLDSLTPWPVRLDLGTAVRAAARGVTESELGLSEVVVLSDLQASALSSGPPVEGRVLILEAPSRPENLGVDSAVSEPARWTPSGSVIASIGGHAAGRTAVRLEIDGVEVARTVASAGDRVVLEGTAPGSGWLTGVVRLDADELRDDDTWYLGIRASGPTTVGVVTHVGRFVEDGLAVLRENGRIALGNAVQLADRPQSGATVVVPPAEPALTGAINRALAARGIDWRFGDLLEGEWSIRGDLPGAGEAVYRRYRLNGSGDVLATVGGEPWLVRAGEVTLLASRLEESWTALPVRATFLPFLEILVNRIAMGSPGIVRARPGEAVRMPGAAVRVELPEGTVAVPASGAILAPQRAGVSMLVDAAGDTVGVLEVNHDARESVLDPADRATLRAALGDGVKVVSEASLARELFGGARRAELTGILLGAALVIVVIELVVATFGTGATRA